MSKRMGIAALIAVASSSGLVAQSTTQLEAVNGIAQVDGTTQTEDVQFRSDAYDRMTVPVRLSGSGPYRFMVDTGADRTAISRQLADRLNLVRGDGAAVHSIAGVSRVSTVTLSNLQLTRRQLTVTNAPLLERSNMGADGILGVDSLRSQRILFDFESDTMSIVPAAMRELETEPGTIVVEARRKSGRLILTRANANGKRLDVILDTGSQVSIGNSALRKALLGSGDLQPSRMVELQSVTGGSISGEYMVIRKLEVGGIELTDLAIVFADAHTFKQLGLQRKPAMLLGMNAMRAFKKVSIDFANKKLRVVLPEEGSLPVRLASL